VQRCSPFPSQGLSTPRRRTRRLRSNSSRMRLSSVTMCTRVTPFMSNLESLRAASLDLLQSERLELYALSRRENSSRQADHQYVFLLVAKRTVLIRSPETQRVKTQTEAPTIARTVCPCRCGETSRLHSCSSQAQPCGELDGRSGSPTSSNCPAYSSRASCPTRRASQEDVPR